ncbi:helix-turn-helix transcriptional regulator [Agrobacterium tumefaciens]|uniref:winged helix-turn-helix transcriptional regulator n=1 Tax=Agrobacterium tumefaciens TaxID=358 RepID=UPI001572FD64|nr:helix-turn-helix domain-containing protein [Agrobacterium tumefaciens]MCZ7497355.1 helix-turn-helix domain-containing protein [Rhizobium rhizogenes]NTE56569.1 helix-turn-helix transcriptional regulator [Agrobacterium tumefaciens]NTE74537.1 helix-turn-helix transcriptional regulator [Agrobacterium tumefaciens]
MEEETETQCPVARSLDFISDAWSILILRDAHLGITRFDEFRKSLRIAPSMLTRRLNTLVSNGLLQKRLYSDRPPREEYLLTNSGHDFLPVLIMLGAWAQRNCGGKLARYIDAETNREIQPVVIDAVTGQPLTSSNVRVDWK